MRQGRPSRGTPTPPGYGYLTHHLPREATLARTNNPVTDKKKSRYSKQEEKRRNFTTQRGCVFWPRRPQKAHATRHSDPAGSGLDAGRGATTPSASTTTSARFDLASDGDAVRRPPLRRTTSSPRPGHRRQGLLRESGPSRRLGRSPLGPRPTIFQGRQPDPRPRLVNFGVGPANGQPG
jgi:hypothetical protein